MQTIFIEATNVDGGGVNWGKFMLARFDVEEWKRQSKIGGRPMLSERGWTPEHLLVVDLQTGEGAIFAPHGIASCDLNEKHKIWVCPLFEPFLEWLYRQDLSDISKLPGIVKLPKAASALYGYRRPGRAKDKTNEKKSHH